MELRRAVSVPPSRSQALTVLSALAENSRLPSTDNARLETTNPCPRISLSPEKPRCSRSHTHTGLLPILRGPPPENNRLPSQDNTKLVPGPGNLPISLPA